MGVIFIWIFRMGRILLLRKWSDYGSMQQYIHICEHRYRDELDTADGRGQPQLASNCLFL
jgi:hypothetical protein